MRHPHVRAADSRVVAVALFASMAVLPLAAQERPVPVSRDSLASALDAVRASNADLKIPPAERFTMGDATVAAGTRAAGPVAVAHGTVHVRGVVDGDVFAYAGDIVVHDGGQVRGNATAMQGRVSLDGGRVDGEVRSVSGDFAAPPAAGPVSPSAQGTVVSALALATGWLGVLLVVGIGVLVFASSNLGEVSEALERDFGRALLAGIAAQLALAPVLVLLLIGLALTLLGILLIPFAVVAYVLAAAGLVTLGYLAIANITGRTFLGVAEDSERARRAAALRGVLAGLIVLMSPWFIAAALAWSPTGSAIARAVAVAITWVACSAGLGAALLSRGGARRVSAPVAKRAITSASWQTPTPVSGVTAARRPTPLATPSQK